MKLVVRLLIIAAAIFGIAYLSDGALLKVDAFWPPAVIAAVVLAVVNAVVRPIVKLIALPVTILTLGLFSLIISGLMLYIVDWVVDGFHVVGVWQAIVSALIISAVSSIGTKIVDSGD